MDLADGHVAALKKMFETKFLGVKIYNLGTGQGASVLEMIKIFENISGREIPYEITNRRPGDISTCYAKCDLAEKELNWKAKLSLKEMCMFVNIIVISRFKKIYLFSGQDMWKWQTKNPKGFQNA